MAEYEPSFEEQMSALLDTIMAGEKYSLNNKPSPMIQMNQNALKALYKRLNNKFTIELSPTEIAGLINILENEGIYVGWEDNFRAKLKALAEKTK